MDGQLFIISENDGLLTDSEVKAKTLYIIMNDFTVSSNTGINGSNKIVPSCSSTVKVFPYRRYDSMWTPYTREYINCCEY